MFSNYFKIAWRNLFANKLHSLINVSGLALGMAAAVLLLLNIQYGLSVDQFHEKKTQLYEVYGKGMANAPLNAWVLLISGAAALLLSLATIGFQTIRAAMANPVKSLRSE